MKTLEKIAKRIHKESSEEINMDIITILMIINIIIQIIKIIQGCNKHTQENFLQLKTLSINDKLILVKNIRKILPVGKKMYAVPISRAMIKISSQLSDSELFSTITEAIENQQN